MLIFQAYDYLNQKTSELNKIARKEQLYRIQTIFDICENNLRNVRPYNFWLPPSFSFLYSIKVVRCLSFEARWFQRHVRTKYKLRTQARLNVRASEYKRILIRLCQSFDLYLTRTITPRLKFLSTEIFHRNYFNFFASLILFQCLNEWIIV